MTVTFTLAFTGVDIDDFDLLDQLVEALPDVHWGEVDGEVQADIYAHDLPIVRAVEHVVAVVRTVAPDARATRLVEDFVATSDVAKRVDVNRETVRLWSKEASFPQPRGVVGNGIRIWDWASVNSWLRDEHSGALGDRYRHPSAAEVAQANSMLRQLEVHLDAADKAFKARPHAGTQLWKQAKAVNVPGPSEVQGWRGESRSGPGHIAVAG